MSEITTDVVSHLANLARIALTPEEIEKLTGELGAIVEQGTHETLLAAEGAYARLYRSQFAAAVTELDTSVNLA